MLLLAADGCSESASVGHGVTSDVHGNGASDTDQSAAQSLGTDGDVPPKYSDPVESGSSVGANAPATAP